MAMSYDIFVPRHLFEHCSAYLRGVPPAACTDQRHFANRDPWDFQRSRAEEEQEQGECWELGMRRPCTTEESRCFKELIHRHRIRASKFLQEAKFNE